MHRIVKTERIGVETAVEDCKDMVSVIVPIYNMEKYLDRCVQSILRQTYTNLEILLIDDGSTDQSLQIMKRYAEQDSRVRVFYKENGGVSSARNLGLDMMHGEYCTFVDPDDYVADVYVEWLYRAAKQKHVQIAICDRLMPTESTVNDLLDETEKIFDTHESLFSDLPPIEVLPIDQYKYFGRYTHLSVYCTIFSTEVLRDIRFNENIQISEDALFFIQAYIACGVMTCVNAPLYCYIQYGCSAVHGEYTPKIWTSIVAWNEICNLLKKAPESVRLSAEAWYAMICAGTLMDITHSKYNDLQKVKYLIHELHKNRKTIRYIPKEKRALRIRTMLTEKFPHTAPHLIWLYFRFKEKCASKLR